MPSNNKRPGGRPTAYKPVRTEEILSFMGDGYSLGAAAEAIGVARQTIHNWMKLYPEFKDAVERAKSARTTFLELALLKTTSSTRSNALRLALVNAAPHEWRSRSVAKNGP